MGGDNLVQPTCIHDVVKITRDVLNESTNTLYEVDEYGIVVAQNTVYNRLTIEATNGDIIDFPIDVDAKITVEVIS